MRAGGSEGCAMRNRTGPRSNHESRAPKIHEGHLEVQVAEQGQSTGHS